MFGRRTLRPPDLNPEGLSALDWVRKIRCKKVGKVESVTDDHALVDWLNGTKEVVLCIYLRRVPPDRGAGFDRRGQ